MPYYLTITGHIRRGLSSSPWSMTREDALLLYPMSLRERVACMLDWKRWSPPDVSLAEFLQVRRYMSQFPFAYVHHHGYPL